jgi:hypothetical protein
MLPGREDYKFTWEENGLYDFDVEIRAVGEIYEASVIVHFVFEGQISQPTTDCSSCSSCD